MTVLLSDGKSRFATRTVNCKHCGEEFTRKGVPPQYCSRQCFYAARKVPGADRRASKPKPIPENRKVYIVGDLAYLPLTRGFIAVLDAADAHLVAPYRWRCITSDGHNYAARTAGPRRRNEIVYLHRVLMEAPDGVTVDHRDNDGLNNRRKNLRLATTSQNGMNSRMQRNNSTGFKGVSLVRRSGKFSAIIIANRKTYNLGTFSTAQEAHAAYRGAAKVLHGKFARFK